MSMKLCLNLDEPQHWVFHPKRWEFDAANLHDCLWLLLPPYLEAVVEVDEGPIWVFDGGRVCVAFSSWRAAAGVFVAVAVVVRVCTRTWCVYNHLTVFYFILIFVFRNVRCSTGTAFGEVWLGSSFVVSMLTDFSFLTGSRLCSSTFLPALKMFVLLFVLCVLFTRGHQCGALCTVYAL